MCYSFLILQGTGEYKIKSAGGISRFQFNADLADVRAFRKKL